MEATDRLVENIMKIKRITGFHVLLLGDPSVGIFESSWMITGDFYFDNPEELENFKEQLKLSWETYCGENCKIFTFEELLKG